MDKARFTIPHALLGGLASLIPGDKGPLSPLRISDPPPLTLEQRAELQNAGILSGDALSAAAQPLLGVLAEAPAYCRLILAAPSGYLDEAIHFSEEGSEGVGISNTLQGLVLYGPADAEAILARVMEFTGSSTHTVESWSAELGASDALGLAILMDLRRKAVLRAIIENQPIALPTGEPQGLLDALPALLNNPQWITSAVQNFGADTAGLTTAQIQSNLEALCQKSLAVKQDGGFLLAEGIAALTDRMLLLNTIINLDAGHANYQNRANRSHMAWLQSGVSEMLHLSQTGDLIRLEIQSPSEALAKILVFLTNPDALPSPTLELVEMEIKITAGVGSGQVFQLGEETVLGRSEQATIRILDSRASRRHAVICKLPQGYQLTDAGSTNGTYLNGRFLAGPAWLQEGDQIAIGETQLRIIRAGQQPQVFATERTVFYAGERPGAAAPETPASPPAPPEEPPIAAEPEPAVWTAEPALPPALPEFSLPATPEPAAWTAEPALPPTPPEFSLPATPEPAAWTAEPTPPPTPPVPPVDTAPVIPPEPPVLEMPAIHETPIIEPAAFMPSVPVQAPEEIPAIPLPELPAAPVETIQPGEPVQPVVETAQALPGEEEAAALEAAIEASAAIIEPATPQPEPEVVEMPQMPFEPDLPPAPLPPIPEVELPPAGQSEPQAVPDAQPVQPEEPVQTHCPTCGNEVSATARFCGACGTRLIPS